jgi:tRNA-dihydrouridine synthase B
MGCPVPKVVKQGAGSALMKSPELARDIVKAVKSRTDLPVTAKIRSGFEEINAVPFAQNLEKSGVSAIAVHGRTRTQYYSGLADRNIIAQVKKNVNIPVIGNGDIYSRADISSMYRETGCDYVMVARGSYGNPQIFAETDSVAFNERLETMDRHIKLIIGHYGEFTGMRTARKHAAWYVKGMRGAARLRGICNTLNSYDDFEKMLEIIRSLQ